MKANSVAYGFQWFYFRNVYILDFLRPLSQPGSGSLLGSSSCLCSADFGAVPRVVLLSPQARLHRGLGLQLFE